jgi:hypothetical protein
MYVDVREDDWHLQLSPAEMGGEKRRATQTILLVLTPIVCIVFYYLIIKDFKIVVYPSLEVNV